MTTANVLKIKELSLEAFRPYGVFGALTPPACAPLVGDDIIAFWPDCGGVLDLGPMASNQLALGICQVAWRELKVDVSEYHTSTGEGILPLDGDIYIHVAPPTPGDVFPTAAAEIFRVPKGTVVVLKPGAWHHAPFATAPGATVNTLILLPQRTYANDCIVRDVQPPIAFEA
jgi:ureidoglycolate lyase